MATETNGDSSSTSNSTKFVFRPSALSDVADKIWKKTTDSTTNSSANGGQINLFSAPALSSTLSSAGTSGNSLFTATSASTTSAFIFGKNISCRVINASGESSAIQCETLKTEANSNEPESTDTASKSADVMEKNARTDVSFDTLAATSTLTKSGSDLNGTTTTTAASATVPVPSVVEENASKLEESAAALEAAKQQTQKHPHLLAPDEVKTGEEDEMNVAQATVKLYVFDAAKQSWTDRGLAIMRINDRYITNTNGDTAIETRIVVRLQGSLRVIVNTKLWPDMLLERVSPKRLRLSGTIEDSTAVTTESEQIPPISIYLISASQSSDVDRIERTLKDRLSCLKNAEQGDSTNLGKKRPFTQSDTSSSSGISDQDEVSPAKKRELDEQNN